MSQTYLAQYLNAWIRDVTTDDITLTGNTIISDVTIVDFISAVDMILGSEPLLLPAPMELFWNTAAVVVFDLFLNWRLMRKPGKACDLVIWI